MLIREKKIWTPDNSYLLEYRERIESGEIIAGQELRMELTNLAEDFQNEEYFYDTQDAKLRMSFMENCVRLTKSPYTTSRWCSCCGRRRLLRQSFLSKWQWNQRISE